MTYLKRSVVVFLLGLLAGLGVLELVGGAQGNVVTVSPVTTFQTIQGWEATIQSGHGSAYWPSVRTPLLTAVLDDAGITRVRLEVTPGSENTTPCASGPCETVVNDNADPNVINPSGFTWPRLDGYVANVLVPLRALAAARGKTIYTNLCYVSFSSSAATLHATNQNEYAEFMEATFSHMQAAFGFVPDAVEMILEPDNTGGKWDGPRIGAAMVATQQRLASRGWTPALIGPSPANADGTFLLSDMLAVPGVTSAITEVSYHRYGGVTGGALTYASTAKNLGKRIGMLEYGPAGITELLYDLRRDVSAWQMEGIGFNYSSQAGINSQEGGFGANYFYVLDVAPGSIQMSKRTAELRQVMRYVQPGAVRVQATSNYGSIPQDSVVAFRNPDGRFVATMQAPFGGSFAWSVAGLPAGTYGVTYSLTQGATCPNSCQQSVLADQTITTGGSLAVAMPGQGTLTVFGKTGGPPPPIGAPAAPTNLRVVS